MKISPVIASAAVAIVLQLSTPELSIASPDKVIDSDPSAAITFADAKSLKVKSKGDRFGLVGVNAGETVNVQLQFSPTLATSSIVIQALDGGVVPASDQENAVGADGKASMRFQAGTQPGLYRVLMNVGGTISTLQFWVADATSPAANPPVLKP